MLSDEAALDEGVGSGSDCEDGATLLLGKVLLLGAALLEHAARASSASAITSARICFDIILIFIYFLPSGYFAKTSSSKSL